jgi:hypothetical protein
MRQAHSKRTRNRGRKVSNNPNRTFDSSGPDVKIRGSASQIFEKYQALARDASSSGDYIAAENFYQHAEHYFRVLAANAAASGGAAAAPPANGAAREAHVAPPSESGRQPQAASGSNGGGRGNGRGRRNVGSVRPNGDAKPPQDPGAGPQPVIPAAEGDQPPHHSSDPAGS